MKKLLSILVAIMLSCTIVAFVGCSGGNGDNGSTVKELEFVLINNDTEYEVNDIGTYEGKEVEIPSTYKNLPVVSIGDYAFYGCDLITSIEIPSSITSIGDYAFSNCNALTSIVIPDSVTSIGDYAFYGCDALTSIEIPKNVESIGNYALSYCTSLANINASSDNANYKSIDGNLYNKDGTTLIQYAVGKTDTAFNISENVTSIGACAFSGCEKLVSITVDGNNANYKSIDGNLYSKDGTTLIQYAVGKTDMAFSIPNSVTNISEYAFAGCGLLTSIIIPDSVTSIGDYAFRYCDSLVRIAIPNNVANMGTSVFAGCDALTIYCETESKPDGWNSEWNHLHDTAVVWNCKYNAETEEIEEGKDSCIYVLVNGIRYSLREDKDKDGNQIHVAMVVRQSKIITTATIVSSITYNGIDYTTHIGPSAFYECSLLTSVVIGGGVTNIGPSAFSKCPIESAEMPTSAISSIPKDNLKFVTINGGEKLETGAFKDCKSLTSVVIGDSVTSIDGEVFSGCTSLADIEISNNMININNNAFSNCSVLFTEENNLRYVKANNNPYCVLIGATDKTLSTYSINTQTEFISKVAFSGCNSLANITIPNSVISIGEEAFSDCALAKVNYTGEIDEWVQISFGNYNSNPVYYAKDLYINDNLVTEATLTTVTKINDYAFANCKSLTSIVIPNSVISIGVSAFSNCPIENATIPTDAIAVIPKGNLKHVAINGGETIENNAFANCTSLTSIEILNSVTSLGSYVFSGCSSLTNITIPESVISIGSYVFSGCEVLTYNEKDGLKYLGNEQNKYYYLVGVEATDITTATIDSNCELIGAYAFANCKSLTSIVIPNSVISIGVSAFSNCPIENATIPTDAIAVIPKGNLKHVAINGGETIENNAFANCTSLTSIEISNSVTSIGVYAFSGCGGLTNLTMPNSITSIGGGAFNNCTSLTNITIPESVISIGSYVFSGCEAVTYNEKDGLKYLGNEQNKYYYLVGVEATDITTATIDSNCELIGAYAFSNCKSLTSIVIPNGVISIGEGAFSGCSSLEKANYTGTIDEWVQIEFATYNSNPTYYTKALYINDVLLTEVILTTATKINGYAFYNCESLTRVVIPNNVTSIGERTFSNCKSLTSIEIANSVTSIGVGAFSNCTLLEKVNYTGTIDEWAQIEFGNEYSNPTNYTKALYINDVLLTEAIITTATKITNYAFYNCESLTSVVVPNSVISIGESAFFNCKSITKIVIPNSVLSIGKGAFSNCEALTIYCEAESQLEDWASDWNSSKLEVYWYSENEPIVAVGRWHYVNGVPSHWVLEVFNLSSM